ncbi:hypothetical protein V6N12_006253 [Hibiscus sabdariffa]|uniref:YABBY protein C-terminal domain-containing protein n=1 Tax=Hibiscus sabdariffa TaxID=183260 RepID=A0ABR2EY97_9ROSI
MGAPRKVTSDKRSPPLLSSSDNGDEDTARFFSPSKRQRAPSAYNRFIKEEIGRLKAQNPNIPHKEAFSTAAKNVNIQGNDFRERKASRSSIWAKSPFE